MYNAGLSKIFSILLIKSFIGSINLISFKYQKKFKILNSMTKVHEINMNDIEYIFIINNNYFIDN